MCCPMQRKSGQGVAFARFSGKNRGPRRHLPIVGICSSPQTVGRQNALLCQALKPVAQGWRVEPCLSMKANWRKRRGQSPMSAMLGRQEIWVPFASHAAKWVAVLSGALPHGSGVQDSGWRIWCDLAACLNGPSQRLIQCQSPRQAYPAALRGSFLLQPPRSMMSRLSIVSPSARSKRKAGHRFHWRGLPERRRFVAQETIRVSLHLLAPRIPQR